MLFWKYFGLVFIVFKHSDQILGKESYEVYIEAVTWSQALQNCEKVSSKLVSFIPLNEYFARSIPILKRAMSHYTNESWVGDYISYEVVYDQQMHISEADVCVGLEVTTNSSLNASHYIYEYRLLSAKCTNLNSIICQENASDLNITNNLEPWPGSCDAGKLWMPPFTTYSEAKGSFGYGNYTTTEILAAGKTYWTGYRVRQFTSKIPVRGNVLQCGYISLRETAILYDDCNANKSYACDRTTDSVLENATTSPGLYAGVCLAAAVMMSLTVAVIIWLRRKQYSFCKLLKTTKEGKNLFRSWSSESQRSSVGLVLENNNPNSETSEDQQADNTLVSENPIYALPVKNTNNLQMNQSEPIKTNQVVAPQNATEDNTRTILKNKYLTMNGSSTEENKQDFQTNNTYDSIECYPNTNSSRYKDLKTSVNETGNNAYGMVAVSKESVYDHTSLRSNEKKVKVTETSYNHVAIDNPDAKTEKENDTGKEKTRPVPAPRTSVKSDVIYEDILT